MPRAPLIALAVAAACGENQTHPGPEAPPALLACLPDLDGAIAAAELAPTVGAAARYLVAPGGAVDLAGDVDAAGRLVWDLAAPVAGEAAALLAALPLAGRWYAPAFPGGELALPLDPAGATHGVYAHDDQALWLLGVASAAESPPEGQTLLVYDAPVALLRFPLAPGLAWTEIGRISRGTLLGLPYVGTDGYDLAVDGSGRLVLPDLEVTQALRVRTRVTVAPALGAAVTRRQTAFLFECLGEVARATSRDGETEDDFSTAAELRRFTF